jgi:hypothetical protein
VLRPSATEKQLELLSTEGYTKPEWEGRYFNNILAEVQEELHTKPILKDTFKSIQPKPSFEKQLELLSSRSSTKPELEEYIRNI